MLVICSGAMFCSHTNCKHRRSHYVTHLSGGFSRGNCAAHRCSSNNASNYRHINHLSLYFECVPWYKGIEKDLANPDMTESEIKCLTRWYDDNNGEDGYFSTEPDTNPDEDDNGEIVPSDLVQQRCLTNAEVRFNDPPIPRKKYKRPQVPPPLTGGSWTTRAIRVTDEEVEQQRILPDPDPMNTMSWGAAGPPRSIRVTAEEAAQRLRMRRVSDFNTQRFSNVTPSAIRHWANQTSNFTVGGGDTSN